VRRPLRIAARGETFYSHNLGLPELREAIAAYASGLHGPVGADRIAVTSSGVTALMLAMQMLVDAGDEVVAVVPVWPNLTAQPAILGAKVRAGAAAPEGGAWRLDLDELLAAVTPATRVLLVNAPNNPTGWTLSRAEQQALLATAGAPAPGSWPTRSTSGLVRRRPCCAPSFLDMAARRPPRRGAQLLQELPDDRLAAGLAGAARGQLDAMGKLIEFNTSCAPVFVQRGGLAALAMADDFVPGLAARLQACRDRLCPACRPARRAVARPGRHVRLLPRPRRGRLTGARQAPGGRPRPGPGARRGLRPGGRRLAALVLCVTRPGAARPGAGPAGRPSAL
jgi:hypothetical protein